MGPAITVTGKRSIGLLEASSIGVGGMIGGGIFAVLGLAVQQAGALAWASFGVAGVIALLTAYAYWKLGLVYPSQGGSVEYLNQVFGVNTFTGGVNWLIWMGYVLMVSIYAVAFGAYGAQLIGGEVALWEHALATLVIVTFVGLNAFGAEAVGSVENVLVVVKLAILGLFVAAGATVVDPGAPLAVDGIGALDVVVASVLIFLAYEGFELIANAVGEMEDPERTLPRALFGSTAFVALLYVLITFVSVGSLPPEAIVDAKEYALARAAEPALGQAGFVLIAVAAMLSTAGAINSSLYGSMRLTLVMACDRQLPELFEWTRKGRYLVGLLLTGAMATLATNLIPLEGIALMSSSVFLIVFGLVNLAAFLEREALGLVPWIPLVAAVACWASFAAVVVFTLGQDPTEVAILAALIGASFLMEAVYRRFFDVHSHPAEAHEV